MSSPTSRDLASIQRGEDAASLYLKLRNDVDRILRDRNLAGLTLGWSVTTPVVPATTVTEVNTNAKAVTVYIRGGTVTNISVDGTALGMTSGTFRINPGGTISITYSVVPTWFWYGD